MGISTSLTVIVWKTKFFFKQTFVFVKKMKSLKLMGFKLRSVTGICLWTKVFLKIISTLFCVFLHTLCVSLPSKHQTLKKKGVVEWRAGGVVVVKTWFSPFFFLENNHARPSYNSLYVEWKYWKSYIMNFLQRLQKNENYFFGYIIDCLKKKSSAFKAWPPMFWTNQTFWDSKADSFKYLRLHII